MRGMPDRPTSRPAARPAASPLEPDGATLARWTEAVTRYALDHVAGLDAAPSWWDEGVDALVARVLAEPVPEEGRPLEELLAALDPAIRTSFNTAGPGY